MGPFSHRALLSVFSSEGTNRAQGAMYRAELSSCACAHCHQDG